MKKKLAAPLSAGILAVLTLAIPAIGNAGDALEDFAKIVILKESNQNDELIEAGQKFLSDHPESPAHPIVRLHLGKAHFNAKNYDDCIEVLTGFLENHGNSPLLTEAVMQRGEAYRLSKQYKEMLPDFQQALKGYKEAGNDTMAPHAQYHIVQAYSFLKETDKAKDEAALLQKDYPSSNYVRNAAQLVKPGAATAAAQPAKRGLDVGIAAPEIEMVILKDGAKKKLSDFRGKVVVIDFWASWCGPCQKPMEKMQTYAAKHPEWGDKVELIALSIDNTKEAASGHLAKKGWDKTTNAWAGEGGFRSKPPTDYNVKGIPAAYVVDPEGKIAATGHPASLDIPGIVGGLLKE